MLKDCLDIFEQILKQEGDKLITLSYTSWWDLYNSRYL